MFPQIERIRKARKGGPSWKREKLRIPQKRIVYRVIFLPTAEESFKKLDLSIRRRIGQRIELAPGTKPTRMIFLLGLAGLAPTKDEG